jgi:CBS domain containing-hemolysin-like protein
MTLFYLLLLLAASATFSGAETGFYSLSRVHVAAEARRGRFIARLIERLIQNPAGFLITLLVGNNLVIEMATHLVDGRAATFRAIPPWARELIVTAALAPILFFFGELLPKDLFRRRPHEFLGLAAPLLFVVRPLLLPIVWPLQLLSLILEKLLNVGERDFARAIGREEMVEFLREGRRQGVLEPHAEELAHNVLVLRETPVSAVMVPWSAVKTIDLARPDAALRAEVLASEFTRLPAVRGRARRVVGYVYQLDLFAKAPDERVESSLRPLVELPPDLPVDRALARLRTAGQRVALVGDPAHPRGLVGLMDLMAAISGLRAG